MNPNYVTQIATDTAISDDFSFADGNRGKHLKRKVGLQRYIIEARLVAYGRDRGPGNRVGRHAKGELLSIILPLGNGTRRLKG